MKISLYLMNSKGLFALERFIDHFSANAIEYVVSTRDENVKRDAFDDIMRIAKDNKIKFYEKKELPQVVEADFCGYKLSIGWRWLIKNERNLIVFHDSILPRYRGFAPLVNSLINGEHQIGVTALLADEKYDCGAIISQRHVDITYPITIREAIELVEPLYFELMREIYNLLNTGQRLTFSYQDDSCATYSPWLDGDDYFIDWAWSAGKIKRFVDAVGYPYSGARARLGEDIVVINRAEEFTDVYVEMRERHVGKIIFMIDGSPVIICQSGLLKLIDITDVNGNTARTNFRSRFK